MKDNYECLGQITIDEWLNLDTQSTKMSAGPSAQIVERTSVSSLKKPRESQTKASLFLDLRRENGLLPVASWQTDGVWLGELRITNIGEHPNVDVESRLSSILMAGVPQKYYLSPTACLGILRRADRRGKELPQLLKDTLMRQATPSKLGGGAEFDRYGKRAGKGALVQTELSGTLGVSQDQTLITTVQGIGIGNGQANQAMGDKLGTLNCMHDQQAVMVMGLDNYNQVVTGDKTHPIRSKAADSDHIPCVMGADIYNQKLTGDVSASLTCNANATSTQPTVITYGLDRASFNQGQNAQYDFAVEEELAPTVLAKGPGGIFTAKL